MKQFSLTMTILAASLLLAGCSSGLLNRTRGPEATNVPAGSNLAMPPDLQLPAPGSGSPTAYQPSAPAYQPPVQEASAGVYDDAAPAAVPRRIAGGTRCPNGTQAVDIYACYNINKVKPDGTKKSAAELQMEMRKAVMAEKRQANPNYGTFKNFGELFN